MSKFLSNFEFSKRVPADLVKNVLLFVLLSLFTYQVGIGLMKFTSSFSIGSLARNMFPAIFVGVFIVIILSLKDLGFVKTFLGKSEISIKQIIIIGLSAVVFGIFLPLLGTCGMIEAMVAIVVMAAFFLSLCFMIFDKCFYAVVVFLLTFPLLSLLEFGPVNMSLIFNWGPFILTPTISFLLILFFLSLVPRQRKSPNLSMPKSLKWAILIFVLISFLSSVLSINPLKSLHALFLQLACPLILLFFILRNLQEEKQVKILAYSMVTSIVLFSFLNLYFYLRYYEESSYVGGVKQIGLPMGIHAGLWGTMIVLVLPMAIVLFLLPASKKLKLILSGSIGVLLFCLVYSLSRSAIISGFAFFSILVIAKGMRRYILLIMSILIIGILVLPQFRVNIFGYLFPGVYSVNDIFSLTTITVRVSAWIASLQIIKDYPILGIGPGLWNDYISLYGERNVMVKQPGGSVLGYVLAPHNQYLEIAVNSGIISLFIWVLMLILILKNAIRIIFSTKDVTQYYLNIGAMAGIIAYLVICIFGGGFVDHAFPNIGVGIYFFGLVSIIVKLMHFEKIAFNIKNR